MGKICFHGRFGPSHICISEHHFHRLFYSEMAGTECVLCTLMVCKFPFRVGEFSDSVEQRGPETNHNGLRGKYYLAFGLWKCSYSPFAHCMCTSF